MSLEGQISRESVHHSMARGEAPSGDLIPWTLTQQFAVAVYTWPCLASVHGFYATLHRERSRPGSLEDSLQSSR